MSFVRPSLLVLGLPLFLAGCSAPKEEGQQTLSKLNVVLEKSTTVLATIHDQQTAGAAGDDLRALAQEWNDLRALDQKFKFNRSTWDQLLSDEARKKTSDLKVQFTMEYDRVRKLKTALTEEWAALSFVGGAAVLDVHQLKTVDTPELENFEKAFARCRRN